MSGEKKIGIRVSVNGNAVGYQPKDPGSTPGCDFQYFSKLCACILVGTQSRREKAIYEIEIFIGVYLLVW